MQFVEIRLQQQQKLTHVRRRIRPSRKSANCAASGTKRSHAAAHLGSPSSVPAMPAEPVVGRLIRSEGSCGAGLRTGYPIDLQYRCSIRSSEPQAIILNPAVLISYIKSAPGVESILLESQQIPIPSNLLNIAFHRRYWYWNCCRILTCQLFRTRKRVRRHAHSVIKYFALANTYSTSLFVFFKYNGTGRSGSIHLIQLRSCQFTPCPSIRYVPDDVSVGPFARRSWVHQRSLTGRQKALEKLK